MALRTLSPKEARIKKEVARLKKIFADGDKNKLAVMHSLIGNAAFMAVSLEELQDCINRDGYKSEYQNGENQHGTKKSPEMEMHIAMTKNHATVIKVLLDAVPPEKRKDSKMAVFRGEF